MKTVMRVRAEKNDYSSSVCFVVGKSMLLLYLLILLAQFLIVTSGPGDLMIQLAHNL